MKVAPDLPGDRVDPDTLDRTPLPSNERLAREYAARRFPALADAPVIGARVCQYTLTGDTHFLVAQHPEQRATGGSSAAAPATASSTARRSASTSPTASRAAARRSRSTGSARARDRRACARPWPSASAAWRSSSSTPRTSAARSGRTCRATELVARARAWAEREGHELLVVFDGEAPEDAPTSSARAYADDAIAAAVEGAEGAVWVVTSDRELRRRVEERAERILGGGSFVRSI